ncbi:MAG: hypothetical protein HY244_14295 [Rhizobiales bacterium]|nr:hypothetical protein [Hyphomicrobiales bacterium]
MIPNRIHFIFGLEPTFGGKPFSFVHYLAIATAAIVNRPDEIVLHYMHRPDGEWWERAEPLLRLNRVRAPETVYGRTIKHFAHKADVLRLQILKSEGGIYLDADTLCVSPFSPLLVHQTVMGIEANAGLCNAVVLAEKGSPFIATWLEAYRDFNADDWRTHAVCLPYKLSQLHPDQVHVEPEFSFFFPTYDDPMHVLLWHEEITVRQRLRGLARIVANIPYYASGDWPVRISGYLRGSLTPRAAYLARIRRCYCLHLWESLWWDPYLKTLSPATLRESGGMYARLVEDLFHTVESP